MDLIRLSKAARQLNVGKDTIVEYLIRLGYKIKNNPNTKLTPELFQLASKEFASSAQEKREASGLTIGKKRSGNFIESKGSGKGDQIQSAANPKVIEHWQVNRTPSTVFKYFGLQQHNLEALDQRYLFYSPYGLFNDPFDCNIKLITFRKEGGGDQKRKRLVDNLENYGICCFSKFNDHILMWSHYAESHRGFCLEFYTNKHRHGINPVSVAYADEFCPLSFDESPQDAIAQLLYVKSNAWAYEKEYRQVIPNLTSTEMRKATYKDTDLKAVYLGIKCPENVKKKIVTILNTFNHPVQLYQGCLSPNSFEIIFEPVELENIVSSVE